MTAATDRTIRIARAQGYPKEIWYFIVCLIFLVGVFHYGSTDSESGQVTPSRRGTLSLRRIPLALVNIYRVAAFRCTLEVGSSYSLNFVEVFLTMTYIVVIFGWAMANTTDLEGKKFDITYYGNRAGTIAASQTVFIVTLGTKNNVISILTGVSYEKLNFLHRMTARVLVVLLWLHAGTKVYLDPDDLATVWLRVGLAGLIAFSVLCVISIRPVRANVYEFFFYSHLFLVLIFLLGAYYHTAQFHLDSYVWPSFLIWALDRFLRLVRVAFFKISSFFRRDRSEPLDAKVELLSPHLVRLRVPRPPLFHWSPGQTAYLILPGVSALPIEAHPFSIVSIDGSAYAPAADTADDKSAVAHWKELVFLINAREGFTKRLAKLAALKENATVTAFIDGPYGNSPDVDGSTIVLISGGTGISYTLPVLLDVIHKVKEGKSACRRAVLVWAIRDLSHLKWVSDVISKALSMAPPSLTVSINIHVTSSKEPLPTLPQAWDDDSVHNQSVGVITKQNSSESLEKGKLRSASPSLLDSPSTKVYEGRPNLKLILNEEIDAAEGPMSVSVCGSEGIARAVRAALRTNPFSGSTNVVKGAPSVTLHVEAFGYA
ncbi:hypothetical protein JAAARDRAFT_184606 [Jaapia argillacea MUCL 33604]|uniref:ferric-chelate reductase (NADPH) n=1 Tax=Jaapia argillacea MUCL 33604 TaxID=933084 RepID=A0A067PLY0_9AGAM|nr:hypothetical protein JAAARDRAFT_184606 [Jaapia argillacea MUCL 33604]